MDCWEKIAPDDIVGNSIGNPADARRNENQQDPACKSSQTFPRKPQSTWYKIELWNERCLGGQLQCKTGVPNSQGALLPSDSLYENVGHPSVAMDDDHSCIRSQSRRASRNRFSLNDNELKSGKVQTCRKIEGRGVSHVVGQIKDTSNMCRHDYVNLPHSADNRGRRARESVTSDPEIYAKSPASPQKLTAQIQRLKEEMLSLRSCTKSFQTAMEKVFDDLQRLKLMFEDGGQPWMGKGDDGKDISNLTNSDDFLDSEFAPSPRRERNTDDNVTGPHHGPNCTLLRDDVRTSVKSRHDYCILEPVVTQDYENVLEQSDFKIKRIEDRPPQRPCSDSFYGAKDCLSRRDYQNISSSSLAWNVDKSEKFPFSPPKIQTQTSGRLREPNSCRHAFVDLKSKLHISKCSIDSGYQDSFVPLDKFPLETTPKTPLTPPIDTSLADQSSYQTVPKTCLQSPLTHTIPNVYVKHRTNRRASLEKAVARENLDVVPDDCSKIQDSKKRSNRGVANSDFENNCLSLGEDKRKKSPVALTTWQNSSIVDDSGGRSFTPVHATCQTTRCYVESRTREALIRPIPKQRTFLLAKKDEATSKMAASCDEKIAANQCSDCSNSATHRSASDGNAKSNGCKSADCHMKPDSKKLKGDLLSRIIAPNQHQVKEETGNSEWDRSDPEPASRAHNRQGSKWQKADLTQVKLRSRNTSDTKRMVHGKRIVTKKEVLVEEDVADSSVVRRRSMRLMQEFQLFDFVETAAKPDSDNRSKTDQSAVQSSFSLAVCACDVTSFTIAKPVVSRPTADTANSSSQQLKPLLSCKENSFVNGSQNYENIGSFQITHRVQSYPPLQSSFKDPDVKQSNTNTEWRASAIVPAAHLCSNPLTTHRNLTENRSGNIGSNPRQVSCSSLKLDPRGKSAFRPFVPSRSKTIKHQASRTFDGLSAQENANANCFIRSSLPSASRSNKQRFLNEFNTSSSWLENENSSVSTSNFGRKFLQINTSPHGGVAVSSASSALPIRKVGSLKQTHDTERSVLSHTPGASKNITDDPPFRSALKSRPSSGGSFTNSHSRKSRRMNNVRSNDLKKLDDSHSADPTAKSNQSTASSFDYKSSFKTWNKPANNVVGTREYSTSSMHRSHKEDGRNLASSHQYETVKPMDETKTRDCSFRNGRSEKYSCSEEISLSSSSQGGNPRKSAFSIFKINFWGKRNKHGRKQENNENKKTVSSIPAQQIMADAHSSSFNSTDKKRKSRKVNSQSKPPTFSIDRCKDDQTTLGASRRQEHSTMSASKRLEHSTMSASRRLEHSDDSLLPAGAHTHGCADAEMMEKFLEAAVASHDPSPKSSFQRIRKSLRAPKKKTPRERKSKDDLDIRGAFNSFGRELPAPRNVHNGQEFTYV